MIQPPLTSDFVMILPDNFLYKEVKEMYKDWFEQNNFMFQTMNDFIQSTIVSVNFSGLSYSPLKQVSGKDSDKRFHRSGIPASEAYKKNLTVRFRMTAGFMNYWILFDQLRMYLDSNNNPDNPMEVGHDTFINSLFIFILGMEGETLFEREYGNLIPTGLDDIMLNKESLGVRDLEFSMTFSYSKISIKSHLKNIDVTNPKYIY